LHLDARFTVVDMNGITISELAERAGVNTSTVRYYERAGLVPDPERAKNGYRRYTSDHETRLLFITRARNLGLSIEQIASLLIIWDGHDCSAARAGVSKALDDNLADLEARISELQAFAAELRHVRVTIIHGPATCAPGLACCTPDRGTGPIPVALVRRS
jgi:DNA-binding transcriptional MerR regulator